MNDLLVAIGVCLFVGSVTMFAVSMTKDNSDFGRVQTYQEKCEKRGTLVTENKMLPGNKWNGFAPVQGVEYKCKVGDVILSDGVVVRGHKDQ